MACKRVQFPAARALILAGAACTGLAACATYHPEPITADAEARNVEHRSLDEPRLRQFITAVAGETPTRVWDLGTLTLAALYFHPSLSIARARLREAEAGVRTARALPNPSLSFEELSHSVAAPAAWTVSPVIDFLIETTGKRAKRARAARALMQAALEDLTTASWQVRAGVRDALLASWAARRRLALLRQRLDYQRQLVTLLEHRFAVGEASALDVERERVSANQLLLSLQAVERQATDARSQLAAAIGIPLSALDSVTLSYAGLEAPQAPPDEAQLRREALSGRSDVRSMLADYAAAEAALALEIANQYPDLTLGPGFSFDSVQNRYVLLPGLQLPVFNRNQGPIAAAAARREEAAARFTAVQLRVLEQVDVAAADYRAASASLATADALLREERDRERRTERSFEAGAIDRPTLLTSQIERSVAEQSRLDALVLQRGTLGALEDALESPLYFPHAPWLASSTAGGALISVSHAEEDEEEASDRVQAPSRVRVVNGRTELVLSRAAERNAGIATAHPAVAPAQASIQAYGQVLDPATLTDVASRYRNAAAQVAAARARASASNAALARAQALFRDRQNMSAAQVQAARSAYETDEASLDAAQSSLAALGATLTQGWGPVLAGAVTHHGALLEDLIARRDYLLAVTLPPRSVPPSPPPVASARLPSGASVALRLVSPGTTADPRVQGLRYYYEAPATRGLLAGLSLPVTLETSGGVRGELVVPESAVVWLEGRPWVYRLTASAARSPSERATDHAESRSATAVFVRESISPERQRADGGYVVTGLAPDARIVVRGAQLLLSEEFRAQVESETDD